MTGEHQHLLDAKGRLFIPAKLREELGMSFYICKGMDHCLSVYSQEAWGKMEEKLAQLPQSQSRLLKRMLFPTAQRCEPDGQGRILLSAALRDYAAIDKNVIVAGVGDHAEIWAAEKWEEQCEGFSEGSLEEAMNLLGL